MSKITTMIVVLDTAVESGAGTDGDVYLGICGREFYLDTDRDNFEGVDQFVLGEGSNVKYAQLNDPRTQQLDTDDADRYPVYIRFAPQNRDDNWRLERAFVLLSDDSNEPDWEWRPDGALSPMEPIWLGTHAGLVVHLKKHVAGSPLRGDVIGRFRDRSIG